MLALILFIREKLSNQSNSVRLSAFFIYLTHKLKKYIMV